MTKLFAWYGDDFTGSAAVLEVLAFAGIPSVLYLSMPTREQMGRFGNVRAVGLAGTARAQTPEWMDENLPSVFRWLRESEADVCLYKICSTLDSSPTDGSIGRAVDIGQSVFGNPWVPCLVAAPNIRRYQCFGTLFAGAPTDVYRLDRHPVMARHPVTPMEEADVAIHLSRQTTRRFGLIDLVALASDEAADAALRHARDAGAEVICLDTLSETDLGACGRLIWNNRDEPQIAIGSQGVAHALAQTWAATGETNPAPEIPVLAPARQIIAVSGSVSPVTAIQIDNAFADGFLGIALDARQLAEGEAASSLVLENAYKQAMDALSKGASPLIFTACGPDDPAVKAFRDYLQRSGTDPSLANQRIGEALGCLLRRLLIDSRIRRVAISGGDSSGYATQQLGLFALQALAPTTPGAAVFRAASDDEWLDGLEIALKGGQMGSPDCFSRFRAGSRNQVSP